MDELMRNKQMKFNKRMRLCLGVLLGVWLLLQFVPEPVYASISDNHFIMPMGEKTETHTFNGDVCITCGFQREWYGVWIDDKSPSGYRQLSNLDDSGYDWSYDHVTKTLTVEVAVTVNTIVDLKTDGDLTIVMNGTGDIKTFGPTSMIIGGKLTVENPIYNQISVDTAFIGDGANSNASVKVNGAAFFYGQITNVSSTGQFNTGVTYVFVEGARIVNSSGGKIEDPGAKIYLQDAGGNRTLHDHNKDSISYINTSDLKHTKIVACEECPISMIYSCNEEEHTFDSTETCQGKPCTAACGAYTGEKDPQNHTYTSNDCCGACGENAWWHLEDGILAINGSGAMYDFDGVYEDNRLIGTTATWNAVRDKIHSVVISNGITTIGSRAFYNCDELSGVVIPESVTAIGSMAFNNCDKLTSIVIPPSVKTIGQEAFCYSGLEEVILNEGLEKIEHHAFADTKITTLTIPDSVTKIGRRLAGDCPNLTTIYMTGDSPEVDSNLLEHLVQNVTVYISGKTASGYERAAWQNNDVTLLFLNQLTEVKTVASRSYTGDAFEPEVIVTNYKGEILTNGTDYTVAYSNNVNAGTATVTISGAGIYGGTLKTNFNIFPLSATVTANNIGKTYGDADPVLTYEVTGLVNDDELSGQLSREAGEDVGTYAIGQGTLENSNYIITYTGANFSINRRSIMISAKDQTIIYGSTISDKEIITDNLAEGHSVTVTLTPSTANVTANGTIVASAAVITANNVDVTANYKISYGKPARLLIKPDTSKIDALTIENVSGINEADIRAVQDMLKNADSIKDEWAVIQEKCEALLDRIAKGGGGKGDNESNSNNSNKGNKNDNDSNSNNSNKGNKNDNDSKDDGSGLSAVATGDDSNIMLWFGMLCVSMIGLAVLLIIRKKKSNK